MINLEDLLGAAKLRYTKSVDASGEEAFTVPFESSAGPLPLELRVFDVCIHAYVLLRKVDSIALRRTRAEFFHDLLRAVCMCFFSKLQIWADAEEVEWFVVSGEVPKSGLDANGLALFLSSTARLADKIMKTIRDHEEVPDETPLPREANRFRT